MVSRIYLEERVYLSDDMNAQQSVTVAIGMKKHLRRGQLALVGNKVLDNEGHDKTAWIMQKMVRGTPVIFS